VASLGRNYFRAISFIVSQRNQIRPNVSQQLSPPFSLSAHLILFLLCVATVGNVSLLDLLDFSSAGLFSERSGEKRDGLKVETLRSE